MLLLDVAGDEADPTAIVVVGATATAVVIGDAVASAAVVGSTNGTGGG